MIEDDDLTDAMVGQQFRVVMEDCCVAGEFVATLASIDRQAERNGDLYVEALRFSNGVRLTEFLGVTLEPEAAR